MAENLRVGPAYVLLGDPTTASGADMVYLGKTRGDVVVNPNIQIATGRADQSGSTPLAGSVFFSGIAPVATVPLLDEDKTKMKQYLAGATIEEAGGLKALGFGSGFKKIGISDLHTLCLLPVRDLADYPSNVDEDPDAIWMPAVIANEFGQLTFNLPDGGDDSLNPHEVQFAGLKREEDQGSTEIPVSSQALFQGAPTALGLTWSLPDPSTF